MTEYIQINPLDNVAVALRPLLKGGVIEINGESIVLSEDIPAGHKIALMDFVEGDIVIKYGSPISHTTQCVKKGGLLDENKVKTNLSGLSEYTYTPKFEEQTFKNENRTFKGYLRANGEVGIRNEIWIIPTVGCVNGVANQLAEMLRAETNCEGVDAIVAFAHNYGCSQLGDDHENTRKILRDMILHPNAGGVLVVGLGCENNQPEALREFLGEYDAQRVRFMVSQQVEDEIEVGMTLLREIYHIAKCDKRVEVPLSKLRVGLKCGGSDGFSGITANPLLGVLSDYIVAQGGTTILTEVPEMFGAETLLMNRCRTEEIFDKTVKMINDFKNYFIRNEQPIYENPSPGNKAGGISTLEEKSLGCTQKAGSSMVEDVLEYGECVSTHGLNLLSAPGNDLVASTALAAAGCHIVLFTTGRGTPFGTFVPTVKISTNTTLYEQKHSWIDFNAGTLIEGESMDALSRRFIDYVIDVASGKSVLNEQKNYREIAIFKQGVTL